MHSGDGDSFLSDIPENFEYDQNYLYDALVQSTDDYIYVCNMDTGVFRYPKAMVEEFGLPGEIVPDAARVWGANVHEHDKQAFLESNQEILDGVTDCHFVEYRAKNRDGEWVWLRCRGHLERDENGKPRIFAGIISNLGKKNKVDHITGLFNKFEFENEVSRLLDSGECPFSILAFGIDDFRHINDLYGRPFGDEVIRIVAQKIQSLLPSDTALYRLDGDEFGTIFRGSAAKEIEKRYHKIQTSLDHQQTYDDRKYFCTVSAGCVSSVRDGATYSDLMKRASCALEYSKRGGKNRLVFFSSDMLVGRERDLELTELLRASVENGFSGFSLRFQPQVDAVSGRLTGAEVLTRWSCAEYGEVPPLEFIPLLEESGLILPAGRWIFEQGVRVCAKWLQKKKDFALSINLSWLQLEDPDFITFMQACMQQYGVDPRHIAVEITESYIASNIGFLQDRFSRMRKLGLKIAMDDFGTGYSSLGILKQSPADIVKISRMFVQEIRNNSFDATFIRFVVELCHNVGIHVCLEGVETEEEYGIVKSMNLDLIQGFLFGRPIPEEEFERDFLDR